jgi:hypothetical protein
MRCSPADDGLRQGSPPQRSSLPPAGGRPGAAITIDAALADKHLLGAALGDTASWAGWLTLLRATFGLSLAPEQTSFFAAVAAGRNPPTKRVKESWFVVGRRSGKSRMAAAIAVYLAAFRQHKLSPGETGFVLVLAASKSQGRTVFDYCRGFLDASPILRQQQVGEPTADEIRLKGNIIIGVHTNNYRTVRGRTLLACIFDEVAFWRDETTSLPDIETYRAVLPSLATTGGPLIGISSPYAQRGLLFERHRDHFGRNSADVLVIRADSLALNPTLDREIIDAAKIADPEAARSEWDAEFRGDLALYIAREMIERLVEPNVQERPPEARFKYFAFTDPSGGAHDSFTLAISHRDGDRVVLDAVREVRAPFEPSAAVAGFAQLLKGYRVNSAWGDKYAGAWVSEQFRAQGITYLASERSKSELYLDALPLFTDGTAMLLNNQRVIAQFAQLERRTSRMGRDVIDHQPGSHDDVANAVAGALVYAAPVAPVRIENLQRKAFTSGRPNPWRPQRPVNDRPRPGRGAQT